MGTKTRRSRGRGSAVRCAETVLIAAVRAFQIIANAIMLVRRRTLNKC